MSTFNIYVKLIVLSSLLTRLPVCAKITMYHNAIVAPPPHTHYYTPTNSVWGLYRNQFVLSVPVPVRHVCPNFLSVCPSRFIFMKWHLNKWTYNLQTSYANHLKTTAISLHHPTPIYGRLKKFLNCLVIK